MNAIQAVETELEHIATTLENEGHALAARARAAYEAFRADVPKLAAEAETDATDVAHTAETQGLLPAEAQAVADGETLITDAGHDLAAAVEPPAKPSN